MCWREKRTRQNSDILRPIYSQIRVDRNSSIGQSHHETHTLDLGMVWLLRESSIISDLPLNGDTLLVRQKTDSTDRRDARSF